MTIIWNAMSDERVSFVDVQDIAVHYDEANDAVTVTPGEVNRGTTVRFKNPTGGPRILFLAPRRRGTKPVPDSELCTLTIGGTYHFRCFFTPVGKNEPLERWNYRHSSATAIGSICRQQTFGNIVMKVNSIPTVTNTEG